MKSDNTYPEEYKKGEVEFLWRKFAVSEDVLIPRLETEVLIKRAQKLLAVSDYDVVIDIGSGSGIIGTSLADRAKKIVCIDISEKALTLTEKNFLQYFSPQNALFLQGNLLEPYMKTSIDQNILIVTNLPYIKKDDWENMSLDTIHEPRIALFGGEITGFELYEELFEQAKLLKKSVHTLTLLIEFGFDQREESERIFQKNNFQYEFFPDYRWIERFAQIEI